MALGKKTGRRNFAKGHGGRAKGTPNKQTVEIAEASRRLLEDPIYRDGFKTRLQTASLAPALEAMLWHYAYGRPVERVEHSGTDGLPLVLRVQFDE